MPRKNISLVDILLPHHVKWRWEERDDSRNFSPPSKPVALWSWSCCQRLTIGAKHCSCFHPSISNNQSKTQNPCPAYCHASADPPGPEDDLPCGAGETCGEGWERMNMRFLRSGQGIGFFGHCMEILSDPGLQRTMTLSSFHIQRCGTGQAEKDACVQLQQSTSLNCGLMHLGLPNIFYFACCSSVLICQKTAAYLSLRAINPYVREPEPSVKLLSASSQ